LELVVSLLAEAEAAQEALPISQQVALVVAVRELIKATITLPKMLLSVQALAVAAVASLLVELLRLVVMVLAV
jgi:hypothetical protein